jgi:broad specificity phosphatase PhoE
MLYFQEPDIEPNYRINGVDLYTTDQTIQHAVKMQEFQLEMLRKQKKVTEASHKEWQGLTDEEIEKIFIWQEWSEDFADFEPVARAIEAKLRGKNT